MLTGQVLAKPMAPPSEWFLSAFRGQTDQNGMITIELAPPADAGSVQATLRCVWVCLGHCLRCNALCLDYIRTISDDFCLIFRQFTFTL